MHAPHTRPTVTVAAPHPMVRRPHRLYFVNGATAKTVSHPVARAVEERRTVNIAAGRVERHSLGHVLRWAVAYALIALLVHAGTVR